MNATDHPIGGRVDAASSQPDEASRPGDEEAALRRSIENVRASAARALDERPGAMRSIAFVRNLQRGLDRVVGAAVERGVRVDCRAGCSHCCHARVEAVAPEIFLIADALRRLSPASLDAMTERLRRHVERADDGATAWQRRDPCPFLDEQRCSIYAFRPTACRRAHSTDVDACAAGAPLIPQDLGIVLDADALMVGTFTAYRERDLDADGHELVRAVALALSDPSAPARWYLGEGVFATS